MADSKRQKIVDAVKTRMAAILTAGGYATNLGQNVEEWSTHLQGEDIPAAGEAARIGGKRVTLRGDRDERSGDSTGTECQGLRSGPT